MSFEREKTLCFTGHRSIPLDMHQQLGLLIRQALEIYIRRGFNCFIAGGAAGFDTIASEQVIGLRSEGHPIKLVIALPCKNDIYRFARGNMYYVDRRTINEKKADHVIYTSEDYYSGCMHVRNRFMVDNSAACIAYMTKSTGGTAFTCKYAEKNGLELVNLGAVATQLTIY